MKRFFKTNNWHTNRWEGMDGSTCTFTLKTVPHFSRQSVMALGQKSIPPPSCWPLSLTLRSSVLLCRSKKEKERPAEAGGDDGLRPEVLQGAARTGVGGQSGGQRPTQRDP